MSKEKTPKPEPMTERQLRRALVAKASTGLRSAVKEIHEEFQLMPLETITALIEVTSALAKMEEERQYEEFLGQNRSSPPRQ